MAPSISYCSKLHFWKEILVLHIFVVSNFLLVVSGMKCDVALESAENWVRVYDECSKTNKVDESKFETLSLNVTLEEFAFDDNCFIQCMYKGNELLTTEGLIDKGKTGNLFKGNITGEMLKHILSIWDTCIDDSEKIAKDQGSSPCMRLALHDFCFSKRAFEIGINEMEC